MIAEHFERFSEAYRAGLLAAVKAKPEDYAIGRNDTPEHYATVVAHRMLVHIKQSPKGVNYNSHGFRRACKTLGIKTTRKAIFEFLGIQPKATP